MRHITGNLFNDDKVRIPLMEELEMWKEIYDELLKDYPYFQFKMIVTGHKWFGKWHIEQMLSHIQHSNDSEDKWISKFICGLDLINEEDSNPEIKEFANTIIPAKQNLLVKDG